MSWMSLLFVTTIIIFTVGLAIKKFWPRNEDGSLKDPDELGPYVNKDNPTEVPKMPRKSSRKIAMVFATIAIICIAITRNHIK